MEGRSIIKDINVLSKKFCVTMLAVCYKTERRDEYKVYIDHKINFNHDDVLSAFCLKLYSSLKLFHSIITLSILLKLQTN